MMSVLRRAQRSLISAADLRSRAYPPEMKRKTGEKSDPIQPSASARAGEEGTLDTAAALQLVEQVQPQLDEARLRHMLGTSSPSKSEEPIPEPASSRSLDASALSTREDAKQNENATTSEEDNGKKRFKLTDIGDLRGRKRWKVAAYCKGSSAI